MTVNLLKHQTELLNVCNDVLSKTGIDWALYGYEGTSNVLKVVDKGELGLEEMVAALNAGKVLYGICRIHDSLSGLDKILLLHWQGDAVPAGRLGLCASHINEVKKFFKGVHIVYTARCEDDVEPESIFAYIRKTSISIGQIPRGTEHAATPDKPKPVGSVYQKIVPVQDINTAERDRFWAQKEQEETQRQIAEAELKRAETKAREEEKLRQENSQVRYGESGTDFERRIKSDSLRSERLREAHELIGDRTNLKSQWENISRTGVGPTTDHNANVAPANVSETKQQFENRPSDVIRAAGGFDKSSNGVSNGVRAQSTASTKEVVSASCSQHSEENNHGSNETGSHNHIAGSIPASSDISTAARPDNVISSSLSFNKFAPPRHDDDEEEEENPDWDDEPSNNSGHFVASSNDSANYSADTVNQELYRQLSSVCARALWDYEASDDTEISFLPGDIITDIEQLDPGWWRGTRGDQCGLFPANYVELM